MSISSLLKTTEYFYKLATSKTVYGPYTINNGRKIVIVVKEDGTKRTVSYPKYLMEEHLGRELGDDETVDHLNFDKDDNRIENLKIKPRDEHSADDTRRVKLVKFKCQMCGDDFERSPRIVRDKAKKGSTGIFCSRKCSGKYNRLVALKKLDKLPVQSHIESEYYRRKSAELEYLLVRFAAYS